MFILLKLEEYNMQYYEQYKRVYQTATLLSRQLRQLVKVKGYLWNKMSELYEETESLKLHAKDRKTSTRYRKTADLINRTYTCTVVKCFKSYGSIGSFRQHLKLKHPQHYQARYKKGIEH